ncbi:hypothetical protein ONZ45_g11396 [Pleurotus djamor]|nr:hypothetical protein ONZ45_g11396 [Pleurotus djamor]
MVKLKWTSSTSTIASKKHEPNPEWVSERFPHLLYHGEVPDHPELYDRVVSERDLGDTHGLVSPILRAHVFGWLAPVDPQILGLQAWFKILMNATECLQWVWQNLQIVHGDVTPRVMLYRKSLDGEVRGALLQDDRADSRDRWMEVVGTHYSGLAKQLGVPLDMFRMKKQDGTSK